MKRIRVAYAYLGFYRDAGGEHNPLALAECLDRERFTFDIVTLMPTTSAVGAAVKATGCGLHELGLGMPRPQEPLRLVRIVAAFYRTFRRLRPDVVQTQSDACNRWARLAARLAGVPVLVTTINFPQPRPRWFLRPVYGPLDRWLAKGTAASVCVARHLVEEQLEAYERAGAVVIDQPFDLGRFLAGRAGLPEIRRAPDPRRPSLGIVGRLSPEKGHAVAIAAMPRIVDAIAGAALKIVGAGPLEANLKRQAAALGLGDHVEFTGHRTDVCEIMSGMDLLLIPSRNEAFGMVVLEAIASGAPIVASRSGAFPEILEGGAYGTLVAPGDPVALAGAALEILSDPAPALEKVARAREHVLGRYTKEKYARRHAELYERLAANARIEFRQGAKGRRDVAGNSSIS